MQEFDKNQGDVPKVGQKLAYPTCVGAGCGVRPRRVHLTGGVSDRGPLHGAVVPMSVKSSLRQPPHSLWINARAMAHGTQAAAELSEIGGTDALRLPVVLCGSFRRDIDGLRRAFVELQDSGCVVLSPTNVDPESEQDGFVYMQGESIHTPEALESNHLSAIERAVFVWLHAPDGYVGLSASLELGFASAAGIPVFTESNLADPVLRSFVKRVASPRDAAKSCGNVGQTPRTFHAYQQFYRRVATARGYERESARDTLLLMVEEVGELARAVRKGLSLKRSGSPITNDIELEMADVVNYITHLSNICNVDLSFAVARKEAANRSKK